MQQIKIKFNEFDDITKFLKEVSKLECDADLSSGKYLVSAKSIMGIFALDISKPVDLIIYSDDVKLKDKFNKWKVI